MSRIIALPRESDPISVRRSPTPGSGSGSQPVDKVTVALVCVWGTVAMTLWFLVGAARHFHIDEFQNAYNASLLALGQPEMADFLAPYMPLLAALHSFADDSATILTLYRGFFFAVYLGSLVVFALMQPFFRTMRGRVGVLIAFTLFSPLWKHGFEIRHDVFAMACLVTIFGLALRRSVIETRSRWTLFVVGLVVAPLQLGTFKAFVYWVPFVGLLLAQSASGLDGAAWKARAVESAKLLLGIVVGSVACVALFLSWGGLDTFLEHFLRFFGYVGLVYRFSPAESLGELARGWPFWCLFVVALSPIFGARLCEKERRWSNPITLTFVYLTWSVVVLYINPTPFRYNLVYTLPFAFAAGLVTMRTLIDLRPGRVWRISWIVGLIIVGAWYACRDLAYESAATHRNDFQLSLITTAEALTAADEHSILDGVGMVQTRAPAGKHWKLHSFSMPSYLRGERETFRELIRDDRPPVLIRNYRWGWLEKEDVEMVQRCYVAISPWLMVLGRVAPAGSGELSILRKGRYRIARMSEASDGAKFRIDDRLVSIGRVVELDAGTHTYSELGPGALVHWVGPVVNETPRIGRSPSGGRLFLFE